MEYLSNFLLYSMLAKHIFSRRIGYNIRQIRNKKNISIEEQVNLTEMTNSQISRIELGKTNTTC
jgi:predicted transcriptional regulator